MSSFYFTCLLCVQLQIQHPLLWESLTGSTWGVPARGWYLEHPRGLLARLYCLCAPSCMPRSVSLYLYFVLSVKIYARFGPFKSQAGLILQNIEYSDPDPADHTGKWNETACMGWCCDVRRWLGGFSAFLPLLGECIFCFLLLVEFACRVCGDEVCVIRSPTRIS